MQLSLIPNGAAFDLVLDHLTASANREALAGFAQALAGQPIDWDWRVAMPGYLSVFCADETVDVTECLPLGLRETDDPDESVTLSRQQAAQVSRWISAALRTPLESAAHLSL